MDRDVRVKQLKIDMSELKFERKACGLFDQRLEVEIFARRSDRHRRVEKEPFTHVDAPKELPVPVQLGVHHPIGRAFREPLESQLERS